MFIFPGSIINNFLSQNNQQYRIPVYQRNYEWSKDQCRKLFEDIVQAAKRNQMHFTGSIVYKPMMPVKGINQSIVIDGQQRLTTIYILLKALVDMAPTEEKIIPEAALFNKDEFGQYQKDETSKLKLKAAKDNNVQLLNLLNDKLTEEDKKSDIYKNYEFFCSLIKEQLDTGIKVSDIYRGIGMLTVAVIQLDANDKAQEIFERINSTGIPLSLADKIRNHVLMTDQDQERLYDTYWLPIERLLPKEVLSSFFLDYLNIKVEGFVKESEAYEDFKQVFSTGEYSNESMLKELHHYASLYHTFLNGSDAYGPVVKELLQSLQKLRQTTVFLFLFRVFDDYEKGVLGTGDDAKKELAKVLEFLLHYSIRRLVCEVGSNSLRGLYKTLYARVFFKEEHKKHYYDAIVSFFNQLTSRDALPEEVVFIQALKENNLYKKNALCKFLLIEIENQGKEKLETENLTIEHIMPQNKNLSTAWQKMLGEDTWQKTQEKYLHTLGNLTLTAYNSELGDKPFDEKKSELAAAKTKVVRLYEDVKDCSVWDSTAIETRADNLIKEIVRLFPIKEPENLVSFADPRYKEYTCDNPADATYKVPNYYILQGEHVNVTNFAEMLRSLIERLYAQDPSIIEGMAKRKERIFSSSQIVMFSYDIEDIAGDYMLKGTDIYEWTGFASATVMEIIKVMLEKYDIDTDDFMYSARSYKKD